MGQSASNQPSKESTFINEFVNVVYGILLGYGFCDSIQAIKKGGIEGVGRIFASLAVVFTIIVVCIYWWDWYKNIGRRVVSNVREFMVDIAILVSLESLFFVYENPIAFSVVFLVLSVLSLAWVGNYHLYLCKEAGYSKWYEYVNANPRVTGYLFDRVAGIGLFGACFLVTIFLSSRAGQDLMLQSWIGSGVWFGRLDLQGNWLQFILIVLVFGLNRWLFFRLKKRPGLEDDIVPKTAQKVERLTATPDRESSF